MLDAQAFGLGRVERLEDVREVLLGDAGPRVLYRDPERGRAIAGRPDHERARPRVGLPHGLEAIEHQVQQRVLQLVGVDPGPQRGVTGGHVEFGETAVAAAERELLEESGVTADLTAFIGLYEVILDKPAFHYAIACYGGKWRSGEALASSDALEARWLAPAELDSLDFAPNVREAIARALTLLER